jgi:hypothetical protein
MVQDNQWIVGKHVLSTRPPSIVHGTVFKFSQAESAVLDSEIPYDKLRHLYRDLIANNQK